MYFSTGASSQNPFSRPKVNVNQVLKFKNKIYRATLLHVATIIAARVSN